jgi:hypothetical protein
LLTTSNINSFVTDEFTFPPQQSPNAHRLHEQLTYGEGTSGHRSASRPARPRRTPRSSRHTRQTVRVARYLSHSVLSSSYGQIPRSGCRPPRISGSIAPGREMEAMFRFVTRRHRAFLETVGPRGEGTQPRAATTHTERVVRAGRKGATWVARTPWDAPFFPCSGRACKAGATTTATATITGATVPATRCPSPVSECRSVCCPTGPAHGTSRTRPATRAGPVPPPVPYRGLALPGFPAILTALTSRHHTTTRGPHRIPPGRSRHRPRRKIPRGPGRRPPRRRTPPGPSPHPRHHRTPAGPSPRPPGHRVRPVR